jgi:copper chaperone
MLKLKIEDMSCNHCISLITSAITTLDCSATVDVDLTINSVVINSTVSKEDILDTLEEIGYPATV